MNRLRVSPGQLGHELRRRDELDVDRQPVLQLGDAAQQLVAIRHELQVDVDRGRAPAEEHRARAARQVDASLLTCECAERAHEFENPPGAG